MPLTPIDVQQKTFATALRGYDLDEVDDFLDSVVVALKDYDQRLSDAQERISTLEAELNDRGDAEGAIARALVAAQRSADSIVAEAKEEAERILANADNEANELADVRDSERQKLQSEIDEIKAKVGSVRASVADLTATIPTTLDQIEDVLGSDAEKPVGATFDAAEPMGGYEIAAAQVDDDTDDIDLAAEAFEPSSDEPPAPSPDEQQAPSPGLGAEFEDVGFDDDGSGADEAEHDRDLPTIEELSDRIDSAFDNLVSEVEEVSEGSHRPWEDD
jgi:cell division initiation protein